MAVLRAFARIGHGVAGDDLFTFAFAIAESMMVVSDAIGDADSAQIRSRMNEIDRRLTAPGQKATWARLYCGASRGGRRPYDTDPGPCR